MDIKVNQDLDSAWSWIVAIGSCWVNFSIYGLWRSYGILYVGFMDTYKVNHQMASWPFTLCCSVYHLIGPIVGLLSQKFTLRFLQTWGGIMASLGVLMVYFSQNFLTVIICIGVVQGLGLGIIRTLGNVVIQQYFLKHRATATGISMAGGTISSFFFPNLAQQLLNIYGVKISFLIFGLIMSLSLIGIAVQRAPNYVSIGNLTKDKTNLIINDQINANPTFLKKCFKEDNHSTCSIPGKNISNICITCSTNYSADFIDQDNRQYDSNKNVLKNFECKSFTCVACKECGNCLPSEKDDTIVCLIKNSDNTDRLIIKHSKTEGPFINLLLVIKRPMFYVICCTFVTYNICLQVFLMSIVDMTIKSGISDKENAIKLISLFSLADLIGRLSFGWLSDRKYISPKNIAIICETFLVALLIVLPNLEDLFKVQFVTIATGLMIGIITILWPILNVDYFGTDKLAILLGLNCFFSGFESLLRPFLIGYYLDYLNRYDLLFYNVAGFTAITALLWMFEPIINKKKKKSHCQNSL